MMSAQRFPARLLPALLAMLFLSLCSTLATAQQAGEEFHTFLRRFTSSAAFQYTRIKFPLRTPVTLVEEDGETEKAVPFTREMWPLLDADALKEERIADEDGTVYVSRFVLNEPDRKVFEAGYDESELDLRVVFERSPDGKWYVTDGYTGWYGDDLFATHLKEIIRLVQNDNTTFKELYP